MTEAVDVLELRIHGVNNTPPWNVLELPEAAIAQYEVLSRPSIGILGWRIIFEVGIRRRLSRPPWRWVAATFVPLPCYICRHGSWAGSLGERRP
jgi:hypothetical protein